MSYTVTFWQKYPGESSRTRSEWTLELEEIGPFVAALIRNGGTRVEIQADATLQPRAVTAEAKDRPA